MVQFRPRAREIIAKVVYYGPPLGGKTTNLRTLYAGYPVGTRGELVVVPAGGDRTIFFDFLPVDAGTLRGMRMRVQLYTVPGQVHYNATRQVVLRGVDAVVFVADSQRELLRSDREAWENLKDNLALQGLSLTELPHVLQYNKRDLQDVLSIEDLDELLNEFNAPFYEAVATTGVGVEETLQGVVKLVARSLRDRFKIPAEAASAEIVEALPMAPTAVPPPPPPLRTAATSAVEFTPPRSSGAERPPELVTPPVLVTPGDFEIAPPPGAAELPFATEVPPLASFMAPPPPAVDAAPQPFSPPPPSELIMPPVLVIPEEFELTPPPGATEPPSATEVPPLATFMAPPPSPIAATPPPAFVMPSLPTPEAPLPPQRSAPAAPSKPAARVVPFGPAASAPEPLAPEPMPFTGGEVFEVELPEPVSVRTGRVMLPTALGTPEEEVAAVVTPAEELPVFAAPAGEAAVLADPFEAPTVGGQGGSGDVFQLEPPAAPAVKPEVEPATKAPPPLELSPEARSALVQRVVPRALAQVGEVRELELEVPVPAVWTGGRRLTLQLRLTLVPEEDSHAE